MHPTLRLIKALKREYEEKIGACTYGPDGMGADKTCVNRWLRELNDPYLNAVFSGITLHQYENMVNFHYSAMNRAINPKGNRIPSEDFFKAYDGLYMECRGTVIDVENEGLVLLPFRKFFNINETEETSLENIRKKVKAAKRVEFSEKLDGSMISASFYNGKIITSGSSCNDPSQSIQLKRADKIIAEHPEYQELIRDYSDEYSDVTLIFEYVSNRYDPHIVRYDDEETLYLTGMRDNIYGTEEPYAIINFVGKTYGIPTPKIYDNKTLDNVLSSLDDKKAQEAEGFVMNIDGFKVKIKYNDYLDIHRLASSVISPNRVIQAMADGNFDDIYSRLPESCREEFLRQREEIEEAVDKISEKIEDCYKKAKGMDKKSAMQWINANVPQKYKGYVRERYLGRDINILKDRSGHYRTYKELEELI